jgi:hypothetical protein
MSVNNVKAPSNNTGRNTGVGSKWFDIGILRGIIIVGNGVSYDTTTIASFLAAFLPDLLNDNPDLRAYPLQNIVEPTDGTKKPDIITFPGDGSQVVGGENAYNLMMRWIDGGADLHESMRQTNRQKVSILIIDSNGQLIGTSAGAPPNTIIGIPAYIYTTPLTMPVTNATVATYETMISFGAAYLNDNRVILDFNGANGGLGYLASLSGLFNVNITEAADPKPTTVSVKAVVLGMGNADLYTQFKAALNVVGAWKIVRQDTGGVIAVTAVAASDDFGGWVLSFDNYTGNVLVSLAGPTELAALEAPVDGFASNQLVETIPAP